MKRLAAGLLIAFASAALALNAAIALVINSGVVAGPVFWPGGVGTFTAVSSGWAGGSVTLQYLGPDGATWITAGTNTTCTANCNGVAYLPATQIKVVVSGSPTALYANIAQVQSP